MNARRWNRRDFVRAGLLGGSASLTGAASAALPGAADEAPKGGIRYRTLGRTKLKVSEVSFGSAKC